MVSKIVGVALSVLVSILIARVYGAGALGVLAFTNLILSLASIPSLLGTKTSLLKLIPAYDKHSRTSAKEVFYKAQTAVLIVSIVLGCLGVVTADHLATSVFNKPHFAPAIIFASCALPFYSIAQITAAATRGLQRIRLYASLLLWPNIAMFICLCVSILLPGGSLSPVYCQVGAWVLAAFFGSWVVCSLFRRSGDSYGKVKELTPKDFLSISLPMLLTASMQFIVGQTGILVLSSCANDAQIGYYSIAVRFATLSSFLLTAINVMAAPKFSQIHHDGNISELLHVAQNTSRLIVICTVPLLLVLIVLGPFVLSYGFGEGFDQAYGPMLLLIGGQIVNSLAGSTGYFLNMTGDHLVFRNIMFVAALLNVALNMMLTVRYGMYGAAIASSASMIFWNVLSIVYIRKKYGRSISYCPIVTRKIWNVTNSDSRR